MPTRNQILGNLGEEFVRKNIDCPRCKRPNKSLGRLPTNFKCADLICDFCGYLAQVKTSNWREVSPYPIGKKIPGAAWAPQEERMQAGVYFPLFLVLVDSPRRQKAIYYLPADLQTPQMFEPSTPLTASAQRAGWRGFRINLTEAAAEPVRLL